MLAAINALTHAMTAGCSAAFKLATTAKIYFTSSARYSHEFMPAISVVTKVTWGICACTLRCCRIR